MMKKIYNTWHKNYHVRIENEITSGQKKRFTLLKSINDLANASSTGIAGLQNKVMLEVAKKQLHLHNIYHRFLLNFHCVEVDIMNSFT